MKFNWGTGAFMLFGGFVLMMLFFVYKASQQNIDLVTTNYYEKEMEFEDVQRKKNNVANLEQAISWQIEDENLLFTYPSKKQNDISGVIVFYKASDKIHDRQFSIKVDVNNQQVIPLNEFVRGVYQLKIDWERDGVGYFQEERFNAP
jgi:hypothetical protein